MTEQGARQRQRRILCALALVVWAWMAGFVAVYQFIEKNNNNSSDTAATAAGSSTLIQQQHHDLSTPHESDVYDSPLLIFTCHRAHYLQETLGYVYDALPNCRLGVGCPIIISEDGGGDNSMHPEIAAVVQEYTSKFSAKGIPVIHIIHHNNNNNNNNNQPQLQQHLRAVVRDPNAAYKALAQHFGWALTQVFDGTLPVGGGGDYNNPPFPLPPLPQRVIILEEDIKVAPDFFSYMAATAPWLDQDPTLYAVSAFNDNGHLVLEDSERLLRSDFFPGLGWMVTRSLWKDELQAKWPDGYWDDWMREPAQRKGRQVVRPEVSRTYHFGRKGGASGNQFGNILERVKLDRHIVDWQRRDLSYLMQDAFQEQYVTAVVQNGSILVSTLDEAKIRLKTGNVRLEYQSFQEFQQLARTLRIMDDEKAMVPRTAYQGIVECRPFGSKNLLFLTPLGGKPFYN
jgi:alpha-1,3-mannosyl-glycoprotein beta-1,2-N-acetylglucosaminyltransferase